MADIKDEYALDIDSASASIQAQQEEAIAAEEDKIQVKREDELRLLLKELIVKVDNLEVERPTREFRPIARMTGTEPLPKVIEKINELVTLANSLRLN